MKGLIVCFSFTKSGGFLSFDHTARSFGWWLMAGAALL
jgi:hypothetical protein